MSRETTEVREFTEEAEARSYAAEVERMFWAYDASATVWQEMSSGKWKVSVRMRDSCD